MKRTGVAILILVCAAVFSGGQTKVPPVTVQTEIENALSAFVAAFDNLDWQKFRQCFAQHVTMFHPAAPNEKRIDSPEAFEKAWLGVFERIRRESGRTSPPYMELHPRDVRIEQLSGDVALVTFHLVDGKVLSRRTVVFKRLSGEWKIVHIHASNLPVP